MIEMEKSGNYTIKQWTDSASKVNFDNMIFEIYKGEDNHLKLIHWTEDDLLKMFGEMKEYWDNEEFWDQVMVGYTDLKREDVWDQYKKLTIHQDACNVLSYHLNDQDKNDKVKWECTDVWAGNAEDLNLKKFRKNQHEINTAIKKKGKEPLPKKTTNNDI